MSERHACGRAVLVHALDQVGKAAEVLGELLVAGLFGGGDAVVDKCPTGRNRNTDPLAVQLAIAFPRSSPATAFFADVVGDIGHIGALARKQERQGIETPDTLEE